MHRVPPLFFLKLMDQLSSGLSLFSCGQKIEEINLDFLRYRQDRITPHTCRHFMANYLMEKGVELKKIRDYLGHESIMTTERYLRERTRRQNLATIDIGNSLF